MLILVATPIGNLGDITERALETLRTVDYILCEDTRHSRPLLERFSITTPLKSFHKFNESAAEDPVIRDLQAGFKIALISDAGTPGICDPGERLVARCRENAIPVSGIPGPNAALLALTCSGFPATPFQFIGFLPKKEKALEEALTGCLEYAGTSVCYESPHRLTTTLRTLSRLAPDRLIAIARELTKRFEEFAYGPAAEIESEWAKREEIKGECVLVISPAAQETKISMQEPSQEALQLFRYMNEELHFSRKDAAKAVASLFGCNKKLFYKD